MFLFACTWKGRPLFGAAIHYICNSIVNNLSCTQTNFDSLVLFTAIIAYVRIGLCTRLVIIAYVRIGLGTRLVIIAYVRIGLGTRLVILQNWSGTRLVNNHNNNNCAYKRQPA